MSDGRHHLYRWYDRDGVLLYLGVTKDLGRRTRGHWQLSWWTRWAAVVDVDPAESVTDRALAERQELTAIISERPVFNSVGAGRARERVLHYLVTHDVDPMDHVDQLPPHEPVRQSARAIGEPARRARPVEAHEILEPGTVNPGWPSVSLASPVPSGNVGSVRVADPETGRQRFAGWYFARDLAAARGVTRKAIITAVSRRSPTVPVPDGRRDGLLAWRNDRDDVRLFLNSPRDVEAQRGEELITRLIEVAGSTAAAHRASGVSEDTLQRIAAGKAQTVRAATFTAVNQALAKLALTSAGGEE